MASLHEFDPCESKLLSARTPMHSRSSSLPGAQGSRRLSAHARTTSLAAHKPTDPQGHEVPQPEAFDFNLFLEQMRHKSAATIAKYVKSFLREFDKKSWTVTEQIKIIHDFLDFIAIKMRECEMWKNVTEHQFENAREGMEKLIMNRLYSSTFCNSTTDDAERDEIVHQKIQIFRWVEERHLDIPGDPHNRTYFEFAQTELLKINSYRAPRDKLICILNCCIVLFGLIRHMEGESGADRFLPLLIYVVIKADPEQLVSNVKYIERFRQPAKLESEAGYYLTNLMGVISFLERMDSSSLSITQEEFDSKISGTLAEIAKEKSTIQLPESNEKEIQNEKSPVPFSTKALETRRARSNTETTPVSKLGMYFRRYSVGNLQTINEAKEIKARMDKSKDYEQVLKTLRDMFPNVDPEVCEVVLQANNGHLPPSIETLLDFGQK